MYIDYRPMFTTTFSETKRGTARESTPIGVNAERQVMPKVRKRGES